MTNNYQFRLSFEVRDYECDFQGIVNNAVYQNYLEHARHVFLKQQGIDFIDLSKNGIDLVVVRIEIDYLYPLRSSNQFYVGLNFERVSRLRFGFLQDIFRLPDNKPILKAKVIGTSLNEAGRPYLPRELEELFERQIQATGS
jgi:acyl-CoA thioester hydrolase